MPDPCAYCDKEPDDHDAADHDHKPVCEDSECSLPAAPRSRYYWDDAERDERLLAEHGMETGEYDADHGGHYS